MTNTNTSLNDKRQHLNQHRYIVCPHHFEIRNNTNLKHLKINPTAGINKTKQLLLMTKSSGYPPFFEESRSYYNHATQKTRQATNSQLNPKHCLYKYRKHIHKAVKKVFCFSEPQQIQRLYLQFLPFHISSNSFF